MTHIFIDTNAVSQKSYCINRSDFDAIHDFRQEKIDGDISHYLYAIKSELIRLLNIKNKNGEIRVPKGKIVSSLNRYINSNIKIKDIRSAFDLFSYKTIEEILLDLSDFFMLGYDVQTNKRLLTVKSTVFLSSCIDIFLYNEKTNKCSFVLFFGNDSRAYSSYKTYLSLIHSKKLNVEIESIFFVKADRSLFTYKKLNHEMLSHISEHIFSFYEEDLNRNIFNTDPQYRNCNVCPQKCGLGITLWN